MINKQRQLQVKDKEENETCILQQLKDASTKLTFEHIIALVKYHIHYEKVIGVR